MSASRRSQAVVPGPPKGVGAPAAADPRVDAYIQAAQAFAQPILHSLRQSLHAAQPGLVEDIKWGMPFFLWQGRPLAHMAAFKAHCAFGFWQGRQVADTGRGNEAMGQFGRIAALADLPGKGELRALVKKAVGLIEQGVKPERAQKAVQKKPAPVAPADLAAGLRRDAAAARGWAALPPSAQRDYVEWLVTAKREETRQRRLTQALDLLAQGKSRNWKYDAC